MGLHVGFHHIVALHRVLFGEVVWRGDSDVLHVGAETDGVFAGSSRHNLKLQKNPFIANPSTNIQRVLERQTNSFHFFTNVARNGTNGFIWWLCCIISVYD